MLQLLSRASVLLLTIPRKCPFLGISRFRVPFAPFSVLLSRFYGALCVNSIVAREAIYFCSRYQASLALPALFLAPFLLRLSVASSPRSLKLEMKTERRRRNWSTRLVVSRVVDVLHVKRRKKPAPKVRRVERFDNFFGAIR